MTLTLDELRKLHGQRVELVAAGQRVDCGTVDVRGDQVWLETPTGPKQLTTAVVIDGVVYLRRA